LRSIPVNYNEIEIEVEVEVAFEVENRLRYLET